MNLDQAKSFMRRLQIRDKNANLVPFRLNASQELVMEKLKTQADAGKPIRAIVLKSRRVGISTLSEGLLVSHAFAESNARAMVLAHLKQSADELFEVCKRMREVVPLRLPPHTQKLLVVPHGKQMSTIKVATAGTRSGGRALSLSALHLSEVAFWRGGNEALTSLLSTVPNRPNTMIIIESTANGKMDDGEAFYEYWKDSVSGYRDFIPIFIPWMMDPECSMPADRMDGLELDDEERDLTDKGVSLEQLAWRRWAIDNLCHGLIDKFHQEYPSNPEEAFISSGNPAFNSMHLRWARKFIKEPLATIMPRRSGGQILFDAVDKGVAIWETPIPGCKYYMGADVAKGEASGDFSALVVWNGSTGEQAARFADKIGPERLADIMDMLGRSYNNAMANIEVTGGWGSWAQKQLRDHYSYPNFYRWKGRDDALPGRGMKNTQGWETNWTSRKRLFAAFREALAAGRVKIHDNATLVQIEAATFDEYGREEILQDHDDITFAALIGWIAVEDYPPPRRESSGGRILESFSDDPMSQFGDVRHGPPMHVDDNGMPILSPQDNLAQFIMDRCERNFRRVVRKQIPDRLEGVN